MVKKILYITMSNLGDALMGLPAFDFLRRMCPQAKIVVVAAPRTKCVFENHPEVDRLVIFDKAAPLGAKIALFFKFRKESFDIIIDLKDTFYRWGLKARHKNPAWVRYPAWCVHSSEKHLYKAVVALKGPDVEEDEFREYNSRRNPSFISLKDNAFIGKLLVESGIKRDEEVVLVVPGARSDLKKWPAQGYAEVVKTIRKTYGLSVVLVGDKDDQPLIRQIIQESGEAVIDLSGRMTFGQLSALVLRSKVVICNDSGVLHTASYLEKPVIGIYGPSDYREYGPWSKRGLVVRKDILCSPCEKAHCRNQTRQCITTVRPYDVMLALRLILEGDEARVRENRFRRILLVRTDRIGDVLISTPVIKAIRDHYPTSYIAMMVSSYTRELVEGNPYLDRVIVFDKDRHNSLFSAWNFSQRLKKEGFDTAIILYPTVRTHLLCFLAGIKERIGYDWRAPYLLTTVIPHKKQEGLKHELEYNFDLLKPLGISEIQPELHLNLKESAERSVEGLLGSLGVSSRDRLVAISPAASCVSRLWSARKFAEVIDCLSAFFRVKVLLVADSQHRSIVEEVVRSARSKPIDLSGRLSLSELASLFKRCALVISNDSGPVHVAVAVKTPVISIFGRNQPGLGPLRWGPLGRSDVAVYKKTDCDPCLAHDCQSRFKCLEAITSDEVFAHARRILQEVLVPQK